MVEVVRLVLVGVSGGDGGGEVGVVCVGGADGSGGVGGGGEVRVVCVGGTDSSWWWC